VEFIELTDRNLQRCVNIFINYAFLIRGGTHEN
jgi:hypothetical protein